MGDLETQIAVIANDISHIKTDLADVKKKLEADYVTQSQFEPVKKIVYGAVTVFLTGILGALLTLILKK